jgi:general secretion pathway protein H
MLWLVYPFTVKLIYYRNDLHPEMQKGFTLLEILIVLVIVALMSAVVVLNVGVTTYAGFMSGANKVASTLELLDDEAVYTNSIIICIVNNKGRLSCQSYKDGEWSDLSLTRVSSWGWPHNIKIKRVYVNGGLLKENDKIRFFASGDENPMSLELTDGVHTTWIDGDLSGNFSVSN